VVTLGFRPSRGIQAFIRGSSELNDAEIFSGGASLADYLQNNNSPQLQRLLNIPEGQTFAVAERLGGSWDRRDNPLGASRGTFVSASVEHVNAFGLENRNEDLTSHFLKYTARLAGYVPFADSRWSIAHSLSSGYNQQLRQRSHTYPDRLFLLGGADSLPGFLQASVIPEDIAQDILDSNNQLTENEVTIRGGDILVNPRAELRIPLAGSFYTALFVDSGNIWLDARELDPTALRYAAGSGLRASTPIGPLALDYGINLDRRPWEDFGAFHFSIGLF
jgi:outer membrane protein assembly factor BamA